MNFPSAARLTVMMVLQRPDFTVVRDLNRDQPKTGEGLRALRSFF